MPEIRNLNMKTMGYGTVGLLYGVIAGLVAPELIYKTYEIIHDLFPVLEPEQVQLFLNFLHHNLGQLQHYTIVVFPSLLAISGISYGKIEEKFDG